MSIQKQNLKDFAEAYNAFRRTITKEEFAEAFKALNLFVRKTREILNEHNEAELQKMSSELKALAETLESELKTSLNKLIQKIDTKISTIRDGKTPLKGVDYFDGQPGKNADEEAIISTLTQKLPTAEKLALEIVKNGEATRDGLELLTGDNRLDKKAIRGLDEEFEKVNKRIASIPRGGGARALRLVEFQFTGDGSTTAFTLPHEPSGKGKAMWVYYNSAWLQPTTHYTLAGKTITFTFTPEAPLSGLTYNIEGTMII